MKTITKFLLIIMINLSCFESIAEESVIFEENFSYLTDQDRTGSNFLPDEYDLYFDNLGWTGVEVVKGGKDSEPIPNRIAKPRLGWWSGNAYLITPAIDLSNGVTVSFTLKNYARQSDGQLLDYPRILLLHAADGVNFQLVDTIKGLELEFKQFSRVITNGTTNSKIKFSRVHPSENAPNRFFIGQVKVIRGVTSLNVLSEIKNRIISVYSNPARIELKNNDLDVLDVRIFDIAGKEILNVDERETVIDISSFEKGIYFIHIQLDNKSIITRKFVKY